MIFFERMSLVDNSSKIKSCCVLKIIILIVFNETRCLILCRHINVKESSYSLLVDVLINCEIAPEHLNKKI